jgi:hypothetical protein
MRTLAFSAVMALALVGCGGPGGNDGGSGGGAGGSTGACVDTMSNDYKCDGATSVKTGDLWTNVINPKCVSTCHTATGSASSYGNYSTAAQFQTVNVGVRSLYAGAKQTLKKVDPNNLQNSSVWLKVIGGSTAIPNKKGPQCEVVGNQMPDGLPALSQSELDQIKNWICTGAQQ